MPRYRIRSNDREQRERILQWQERYDVPVEFAGIGYGSEHWPALEQIHVNARLIFPAIGIKPNEMNMPRFIGDVENGLQAMAIGNQIEGHVERRELPILAVIGFQLSRQDGIYSRMLGLGVSIVEAHYFPDGLSRLLAGFAHLDAQREASKSN